MNHENDADPDETPIAADRPPRRKRMDSLPGPRPNSFPAALGAPVPTLELPTEAKPAAEISVSPGSLYVTVELPGAPKDAPDIQAKDTSLRVVAPCVGAASYCLDVDLPVRVDPESAQATYRNGILDVTLTRKHSPGDDRDEA